MNVVPTASTFRFLFDEHMNIPAMKQLRERGIDVLHVEDVGLLSTGDAVIFEWARREHRIIVTRNYRDFAPLVSEALRRRIDFPGVLFCAQSIPQSDVGSHVHAVELWIAEARAAGLNPLRNTYGWLR